MSIRIGLAPVLLVSLAFLVLSCTPTTGTRTTLDQAKISKILNLGVRVIQNEEFSVNVSRMKSSAKGAARFGLLGAGVEAAMRSSSDSSEAERFEAILRDFKIKDLMDERLRYHLKQAKTFSEIVSLTAEDDSGERNISSTDSVLEVTMKEWGLRRCFSPGSQQRVQVGLVLEASLSTSKEGEAAWEREELYLDRDCLSLDQFRSQNGLLIENLSRATDILAAKMVNDILFP